MTGRPPQRPPSRTPPSPGKGAPSSTPASPGARPRSPAALEAADPAAADFQQQRLEAFGLESADRAKRITPEGKARLGVLRAKMDAYWQARMARAERQPSALKVLAGSDRTAAGPATVQRKATSLVVGHQVLWYDDENLELGTFSTKEALLAAMRDQPVQLFDVTGRNVQQVFEAHELDDLPDLVPHYARRNGPYSYRYAAFDPNGVCRLEVRTPAELDPVGYAVFRIETVAAKAAPAADEAYTKAHVLGREGKVAHLTHLYNNTLIRDGPADIYSGFGTELLKTAERDAKAVGAKLMYLEAANSMVRKDPNTNEKEAQASSTFYAKYGYGVDPDSAVHNWVAAQAEAVQFGVAAEQQVAYVQRKLRVLLEGMMSKKL